MLALQYVLAVYGASYKRAIFLELEGRYLCLELQVVCDVLADLFGDLACFLRGLLDDYKSAGLGDFEVDALAVWGVPEADQCCVEPTGMLYLQWVEH